MTIVLEELTKRYDGYPVVNNVSLEVADGEFFVLLGSSGSGKTTILTMIAGLTGVDSGRILLHGRDVTHLPTQERRVGFVFQNYALFQHMSVADNVEFGLRVRKRPAAERRRRRDELLELVGLAGLGGRMPRQLSGGQQQRVALARALAHQPEVLLLDEPLGALDAKIRIELRRTLRAIQRELGITTILVTHDQEEAFELADRLGVMSFGRLLEVGQSQQLYQQPQTEFVATFLGTANLLVGNATQETIQIGPHRFPIARDSWSGAEIQEATQEVTQRVQVLFRPEDVVLAPSAEELNCPPLGCGEVEQITFGGSYERLRLRLPPIAGVRPISPPVAYGGDALMVEATRPQDRANRLPLQPGQDVWVGINQIHALTHPGLRLVILTDGSSTSRAALTLAGSIAKMAHARVTIICYGLSGSALEQHVQEVKEHFGSGLAALDIRFTADSVDFAVMQEVEREPVDLMVMGHSGQSSVALAERLLQWNQPHLLLVPKEQTVLTHGLICVASGEPGKEDVLFSGRLLRHLGATATLMAVLPEALDNEQAKTRAERFLANGVRTLGLLDVPAQTTLRVGPVYDEIQHEIASNGAGHSNGNGNSTGNSNSYDLLVLGMPLPNQEGRIPLTGLIGQLVRSVTDRPILLVRSSRESRTFGPYLAPTGNTNPVNIIKESL